MDDNLDPTSSAAEIERIESLLRDLTQDDLELAPPPPEIWDGIDAAVASDKPMADLVRLDGRRRFSPRLMSIVAAAAAVIVVVGAIAVTLNGDDDTPLVVASSQLSYDPALFDELGADAAANVALIDDGGTFRVELVESDLPSPSDESADLELWLIEPDEDGNPVALVSLGLIDPRDPGDFDVPASYDPDVYSVVDISVEPRDGDANHSGRSILRGSLIEK